MLANFGIGTLACAGRPRVGDHRARIVEDVLASQVRLHHEGANPHHDSGHSAQDVVSDYAEAPAVGHGWPARHSRFEHWTLRPFDLHQTSPSANFVSG